MISQSISALNDDFETFGRRLVQLVFRDREGLTLFVGAVTFFMLIWRMGFFSTDSYAIANAMTSVPKGRFFIDEIVYGPYHGDTPGMHLLDGKLFARNYGQIAFSLPSFFLFKSIGVIANLRVAIVGIWSLLTFGLLVLIGIHFEVRQRAIRVGTVVVLLLFFSNVIIANPLDRLWIPLMALQVSTMTAAGFIAVIVYRLISHHYNRRIGVTGGIATIIATPVGFWAAYPKRHSYSALFVLITLFAFYRSRASKSKSTTVKFRALAYASVGLLAWIHAGEGLVLGIALIIVDIITVDDVRLRDVGMIGFVFTLSLIPFFVTNLTISGNPLLPPRLLPGYSGNIGNVQLLENEMNEIHRQNQAVSGSSVEGSIAGGGQSETNGNRGIISEFDSFLFALDTFMVKFLSESLDRITLLVGYLSKSLDDWFRLDLLYHLFIRSGYIPGLNPKFDRAINLSVLESMPLFGVMAAAPVLLKNRVHSGFDINPKNLNPITQTDLLALLISILFITLYLDRFPLHHMLTVRYLHPIYPIGIYGLSRIPAVRNVVTERGKICIFTYLGTIIIGVIGYIVLLSAFSPTLSEAVQFHAIVAGVAGLGCAVWALYATIASESGHLIGAVVLSAAAGIVTIYLLLGGLSFFAITNEFALPISRVIAEHLLGINPHRFV